MDELLLAERAGAIDALGDELAAFVQSQQLPHPSGSRPVAQSTAGVGYATEKLNDALKESLRPESR